MSEFKKKSTLKSPYVNDLKKILRRHKLHTVCESAHCPNIGDCFRKQTATFLIMGDVCTRNCRFCNIDLTSDPLPLDPDEPKRVADVVAELGLKYVVVTSVTRDDLDDGGAAHFAEVIREIRKTSEGTLIEVLTPDFVFDKKALDIVAEARPDVFNHNVETIERLYPAARPQADYNRSLEVIRYMKEKGLITKSGIMVGIGENEREIQVLMGHLRDYGCDIMTIGQYLQPTKEHLALEKNVTEEEFERYREYGLSIGFKEVYSGRFVRSSFNASEIHDHVVKKI